MVEATRTFHIHTQPVAEAAHRLAELLAAREGRLRLAVAGGSAGLVLGTARRRLGAGVWNRVRLTWVDERCVPFAHPDSNRGAAYRSGHLDGTDPPALELPLFLDGEAPAAACARVWAAFQGDFGNGLDLLLLGLGEDGHIASLFPGREWTASAGVLAVADSPKPPASRISFTLPVLARTPATVMLVLGEAKRDALQRLRKGDPTLPASRLPGLEVFTDLEALVPGESR